MSMKESLEGPFPSYNFVRPIRDSILGFVIICIMVGVVGIFSVINAAAPEQPLSVLLDNHRVFSVLDCIHMQEYLLTNDAAHKHHAIIYDMKCL